jgi:kelch-like protein 20
VGLAVVNGVLMAIGGFDGTTYLKTCEVFDPDANMWKLSGSMIYRRLGGGVGVIKMTKENSTGAASNENRLQSPSSISICKA